MCADNRLVRSAVRDIHDGDRARQMLHRCHRANRQVGTGAMNI